MKERLFISRSLSVDSPVRQFASDNGIELIDRSLIEIRFRTLRRLPYADWYFFYSKNGVRSYLRYLNQSGEENVRNDIKLAAIGPGTAALMTQNELTCSFTGDGGTDQTVSSFLEISKEEDSILFFRARHSANRLMKSLRPYRKVQSVVAYDNDMLPVKFSNVDIAVFTSSRNAEAFFKVNPFPNKKIIAIGQPTYDALIKLSVPSRNILVAEKPSEVAITQAIKEALNI